LRARLVDVWPDLSYLFGIHPRDVWPDGWLNPDELQAYLDAREAYIEAHERR
jgi:hypothetical protein